MTLFGDDYQDNSSQSITVVEMECVKVRGMLKVRITSPGPFQGANVNCSRELRVEGARYRGRIYLIQKRGQDEPHCILVNEQGNRDVNALERLS